MIDGGRIDTLWRRVFELAGKGRYSTSPNPRVGALLVDDEGRILGEGFHERAGGPHAEVVALAAAGEAARGATMLVNLEPCAHYGRTPPCTEALLAAGVKRVVCSVEDLDPRTPGRGIRRLKERGVDVEVGPHAAEALRLNEMFLVAVMERRPFVHLKWGATLDGKTAARGGASRWITGEAAREDAMRLREECDAILVGAGTVLADDPRLTRRLGLNGSILPHRRIVLDGTLRVSPFARVFTESAPDESWLVTAVPAADPRLEAFRRRGVRVESLAVPPPSGMRPPEGVDIGRLLALLNAKEVRSLLVEGGGRTAWSFVSSGVVDRVTAYVAPSLMGGAAAPSPVSGEGFPSPGDALRLGALEADAMGPDVRLTTRVRRE